MRTTTKRLTRQPRVERSSGNVFADIGLLDAEEHLVKASLASRIDDIIGHRRLSQVKTAALTGLKQPDVSRLLSGDFRDFERLLRLLMALDCDIDIVIQPKPPRARRAGRIQVVAAA